MRQLARVAVLGGLLACQRAKAVDDAHGEPPPLPPPDAAACTPVAGTSITARNVAITLGPAVLVAAPPGDHRNFVVEQEGRIRILDGDTFQPATAPFLDISENSGGPVHVGGTEQGLLGLAFHPDFAHNGTFYVFYTPYALKNVLARYRVDPNDPSRADPTSGEIVLSIDDYADTHNGGMLEFGADGYLYIGTGDGGKAGDPNRNGQNAHALLGKILRIDVDHPAAGKLYGIPPTNPYADGVAGAPEVFMIGARNPWRWSFDRATGDLWIGDVGQDALEEIDMLAAGSAAGANLGWSMYEASSCYHAPCAPTGITFPRYEVRHNQGFCAIIAGERYRASCYPDLQGMYLFTDYCKHALEAGTLQADGSLAVTELTTTTTAMDGTVTPGFPVTPSSLHMGASDQLYLTTTTCCGTSATGAVYRLEVTP